MAEKLEALKGKSVFLVESGKLLGEMYAECLVTRQMSKVKARSTVPDNLDRYMEEEGMDSAIIHISKNTEVCSVLRAHKSGKRIVVIRRNPPISSRDVKTYREFEKEGVPMVDKRMGCFQEALEMIAKSMED